MTGGEPMTITAPTTPEAITAAGHRTFAARAIRISKVHGHSGTRVTALDRVTLGIPKGSFTAVMGPSGSGKSTLMHCMAGLDSVSSGEVYIGETGLGQLSDKRLTRLRRDRIGFVFQTFNLVPTLSAGENITLPLELAGRRPDREWIAGVIDSTGLRDRLSHRPAALSGGEQQRVACARALATRPEIIFADEPTGNLDSASSAELLTLLRWCVREMAQTVVMVTHDPMAAAHADRVVFLRDGRIRGQIAEPTAEKVLRALGSGASGAVPGDAVPGDAVPGDAVPGDGEAGDADGAHGAAPGLVAGSGAEPARDS
jgi:putative ABC transport system ATP-binding protein